MSSESEEDTTQIQEAIEAITEEAEAQIKVYHWTNVMKKVGKGKSMGKNQRCYVRYVLPT